MSEIKRPEMIRVYVSRKGVEAAIARGYRFVRPEGKEVVSADGRVWHGDAVVMEIPADVHARIQNERRAGNLAVSRRIQQGELPIPAGDLGVGVSASYTVEEVRDASEHVRR